MKVDALTHKVPFAKTGSGEFYANLEFFKIAMDALEANGNPSPKSQFYNLITQNDSPSIASEIAIDAQNKGKDYTEAYNATTDMIRETRAMDIIFKSSGSSNLYNITEEPGYPNQAYYQPLTGQRGLRNSTRYQIFEELKEQLSDFQEGMNDIQTIYKLAINKASNAQGGEEMPSNPATEKTVIRERVIEREKEPVLEGMLQAFMMEALTKVAVDEMVPQLKQKIIDEFGYEPVKHEVKINDVDAGQFDGVTHSQFDRVMHCLVNDLPVYMYGPAGSGKNVLTEQCAKAMGLDYYFMNSVTDEFKIAGFIDANGIYHETEFYKAFVNGGVFFLDEVDASAPEVLVCLNAAIANRYFAFPIGAKQAHKDFRVVAAGNTLGTGADAAYTGRLQLDAATLNRFVIIPVDYDERIDNFNAQGDEELCEFIKDYRKSLKECGLAGVASYRNISQIKALEPVMPLEEALCYALTKEMNKDDINTMVGRGFFSSRNRYFKAMKNIESVLI